MPPTRSKEPRKKWEEQLMVKAIKLVRERKMGTLKAAKKIRSTKNDFVKFMPEN